MRHSPLTLLIAVLAAGSSVYVFSELRAQMNGEDGWYWEEWTEMMPAGGEEPYVDPYIEPSYEEPMTTEESWTETPGMYESYSETADTGGDGGDTGGNAPSGYCPDDISECQYFAYGDPSFNIAPNCNEGGQNGAAYLSCTTRVGNPAIVCNRPVPSQCVTNVNGQNVYGECQSDGSCAANTSSTSSTPDCGFAGGGVCAGACPPGQTCQSYRTQNGNSVSQNCGCFGSLSSSTSSSSSASIPTDGCYLNPSDGSWLEWISGGPSCHVGVCPGGLGCNPTTCVCEGYASTSSSSSSSSSSVGCAYVGTWPFRQCNMDDSACSSLTRPDGTSMFCSPSSCSCV